MEIHTHRGKKLIAKNSVLNLIGQILPMLVGVVTIPYIVHGLGTTAYGILSLAYLVLGYFSIFDLGLSRATVKFVAENLSPEKIDRIPELVWTSLSLLIALGCVGGALAAAFVPVSVTHLFKMPADFVGQARSALFLLCLAMPIMLANDALRGVLEATQRFDLVNLVKVPASVLFYLVAAVVIRFGVHVTGIVALLVLIRLLSACVYLSFCLRVFPGLRKRFAPSRVAIKPLAVFGGWIMVSNVTGPVFAYLERFMIASVLSVGMLTYYSVPFDLVGKLAIFPMSIVPSLFPYFSYHGTEKSTEVAETTSRTVKYMLLVLSPLAATFIFFSHDILRLWMGSHFASESAVVLQIITLIFFINAFAMIPYTSVQALGRPDLKAMLDLAALPVYALISWWLMHRMGINGAALAKLILTIADCSFLYFFAARLKAFSIRDCLSGPLLRAILASGGLFLLVSTVRSIDSNLFVSVPIVLLSFVLYAVTFWILAVDDQEKTALTGLSQRFFSATRRRQPDASV
jgi:O-antigen/teichoic acid export membrane protein